LTTILNLALNNNTIPYIWKLAKIVPVPKPNKDHGDGSSYRPISLLSQIAKTLEKIILPKITSNIPIIDSQHGFKSKRSTITALHNLNAHIARGFNNKKPPTRTIVVALDMSKAFDTVNTHILINKMTQTNIPHTILKYISNYIKGRKAYTIYNTSSSRQRQFKAGVPQGGVLSPTLFNI
jgi:retron-type reverse transcriptase